MRTPIAIAVLALLAFATSPPAAADRACRPSLSNFYNCPDTSAPATKSTQKTTKSDRACIPSLSNGYYCPTASTEGRRSAPPKKKTASAPERDCRPSLSNGFSCPNTAPSKNTASTPERGCRPSLSNGSTARDSSEPINTRRKRWRGYIAPSTPLSGRTPARASTTSAPRTITGTPKREPICASDRARRRHTRGEE